MTDKNDDKIKKLLSGTRIEANENLKFRIMQQIQTESMLSRLRSSQKERRLSGQIKNLLTVFGVMYALIAIIGVMVFLFLGEKYLTSPEFLFTVGFIGIVSTMFGLINHFDKKLRQKNKDM